MLTLALIGFLGGLITGVSPCVLPMLPIIFFASGTSQQETTTPAATSSGAASNHGAVGSGGTAVLTETVDAAPAKKRRNLRPLVIIAGLVTSFSLFTLLGSTLLSVLGLPDDLLRWVGLVVLTIVGLGLIFPPLGHLIERPFYRLPKVTKRDSGAFLFGMGLGTLYVPCAGPILAAITVAGATGQIGWRTVVLTISFAIGAALPLLAFAFAGNNIRNRINAYRTRDRAFRIVSGVVLIGVAAALALNVTDTLQRAVPAYTGGIEKQLAQSDAVQGALSPFPNAENKNLDKCIPGAGTLASCGTAPALRGTQQWFNTSGDKPVTLAGLKGKVVLIDFFAYSCINCQRDQPYIESWSKAYAKDGLQVLGIHSPEFAFEKSASNLAASLKKEGTTYPVVQDNDLKTWTAYRNSYWPAKYLVDTTGTVRAIKFGEGDYAQTEKLIRQLLTERPGAVQLPAPVTAQVEDAVGTPADKRTPELYLSAYQSAGYYGSPQISPMVKDYRLSATPRPSTFSYGGRWNPTSEYFQSTGSSRIRLRYTATEVYNVLAGKGTVTVSQNGRPDKVIKVSGTPNLYTVAKNASTTDGTITLSYSKGVQAYTFTFG